MEELISRPSKPSVAIQFSQSDFRSVLAFFGLGRDVSAGNVRYQLKRELIDGRRETYALGFR